MSLTAGLGLLILFGQVAVATSRTGALRFHATVFNGELIGSAFALSDTIAVTNAHVLEGRVPGDRVDLVPSERDELRASVPVLAISRRMDLAVLRIPSGLLPPVTAATARGRAGQEVVAAGVDASGGPLSGARLSLWGRVVNPHKDIDVFGPGMIVGMPGIRPGFSGGPLLDGGGRLIGMVTAIRQSRSGDAAAPATAAAADFADEAYVLRGPEVWAEAMRLLRAAADSPAGDRAAIIKR